MDITVINKYHGPVADRAVVDIQRPSALGNPYSHMTNTRAQWKVATREEAVAKYRPWLWSQYKKKGDVYAEIERLFSLAQEGPLSLLCCCAPKACHGDIVRDCLLWLGQERGLEGVGRGV